MSCWIAGRGALATPVGDRFLARIAEAALESTQLSPEARDRTEAFSRIGSCDATAAPPSGLALVALNPVGRDPGARGGLHRGDPDVRRRWRRLGAGEQ
jgi:hypothetical protein